jgi:hypothetical protein
MRGQWPRQGLVVQIKTALLSGFQFEKWKIEEKRGNKILLQRYITMHFAE